MKIDRTKRQYRITVGKNQLGPFTYGEIVDFLEKGKIKKSTYVLKDGSERWEYLGELPEFDKRVKSDFENNPKINNKIPDFVPPADPSVNIGIIWVIYDKQKNYHYSTNEVKKLLSEGKIRRGAPAWTKGYKSWKRLSEIDEFREVCYPDMPKTFKKVDCYTDEFEKSKILNIPNIMKSVNFFLVYAILLLVIIYLILNFDFFQQP